MLLHAGNFFFVFAKCDNINPVAFLFNWSNTKLRMDQKHGGAPTLGPAFTTPIYTACCTTKERSNRGPLNGRLFLIVLPSTPFPLLANFFLPWLSWVTGLPHKKACYTQQRTFDVTSFGRLATHRACAGFPVGLQGRSAQGFS